MTSESLFQFCAYWIPIKPSVSANLTQNMTTWKPLSCSTPGNMNIKWNGYRKCIYDVQSALGFEDLDGTYQLSLCQMFKVLPLVFQNWTIIWCHVDFLCDWGQIYLGWRSARGEWALIRSHLSHGKHEIFERHFLVKMKSIFSVSAED